METRRPELSSQKLTRRERRRPDLSAPRRLAVTLGFFGFDNAPRYPVDKAGERMPVPAYSKEEHKDLLRYAHLNAKRAHLIHDPDTVAALKRINGLNMTFSGWINGTSQRVDPETDKPVTTPDPTAQGFSRHDAESVIRGNLSDSSVQVAADMLYLLGASPSAEPVRQDIDGGGLRTEQEFTSSTGLVFVEITRTFAEDSPHGNQGLHQLLAYLPTSPQQG